MAYRVKTYTLREEAAESGTSCTAVCNHCKRKDKGTDERISLCLIEIIKCLCIFGYEGILLYVL